MIHITDKPNVTPAQAMNILQRHTNELGVFIDIDRIADYQAHASEFIRQNKKGFYQIVGSHDIKLRQGDLIIRALAARLDFDVDWFRDKTNTKGISFRREIRERVINDAKTLGLTEDQLYVMNLLNDMSIAAVTQSSFKQYLEDTPYSIEQSFEGHRMAVVKPEWNLLATYRIQASNPSFQNVNKNHLDIITYPKGYNMVYADSGQIEPRIMYSHYIDDPLLKHLIEIYNDAYFGQLHYCTLSPDEFNYFKKHPLEATVRDFDASKRKELKLLGLAGAYGSQNLDRFDQQLATNYTQRIVNHPARQQWEREVDDYVRKGGSVFTAAFGSEIRPEATGKYQLGSTGWHKHLVRCGINNPIQTTAAELMAESVYQADKILRTKAKGYARIAAYVHDAGLFYLPDEDMHLADELIGCLSYQVRDWIPIYAEGGIGKKPGQEDVPEY